MKKAEIFTVFLPYPGKNERRIWVYVPEHGESELLPVIYMTDGQNLFYEEESAFGCWKVIDAIEAEIKNGGSGAVIVGIDHGEIWRDNELTPGSIGTVHPTDMPCYTNAEGEIFDGFVLDTVMPYIEARKGIDRLLRKLLRRPAGVFYRTEPSGKIFLYRSVFSGIFVIQRGGYAKLAWQDCH